MVGTTIPTSHFLIFFPYHSFVPLAPFFLCYHFTDSIAFFFFRSLRPLPPKDPDPLHLIIYISLSLCVCLMDGSIYMYEPPHLMPNPTESPLPTCLCEM